MVSNAFTLVYVLALGVDDDSSTSVTDRLAADNGPLNALLVVVLLTVTTPLAEELLFRGYFFRALSNWRGAGPAVVVSTVVFAVTHVGWTPTASIVPIALFGLGLCLIYHWTGSLYPALAMHSLLNSVDIGPALGWSWVPVTMVGSIVATLAVARLIAIGLDRRRYAL